MRNLFFSVLLLFSTSNFAQRVCGTMDYQHMLEQHDHKVAEQRMAIEQFTSQYIANNLNSNNSNRAVITIPVVVHVVYNTAVQNISAAQIQTQIDVLNRDFAKLNSDTTKIPAVWKSLAANTNIQFCLAQRDPNGNATTGITRTSTTTTSFSTNNAVKTVAPAWPAASYLNLWVCNLGSSLLGYAQFPGGPASTDGVVVTYTGFGTNGTATAPYNLGRTATHEVGHWLNLYHIWGDDGGSCSGSDQVGDTPNQANSNGGSPTFPRTDACTPASPGVMFMNYMDYTNDAAMYMFTNGQNTRIQSLFATGGSKASLKNSLGCVPVSNSPVALFTGTPTTICPGSSVAFTSQSTGAPTSYSWTFTGGTPSTSTATAPTVVYNTPGTYTVSLTVSNSFGTNTLTKTAYINVVNASPLPVVEGFESTTFPPANWTIGNPDNLTAWVRTTSASGFGTSTASAYFDNYTSNYSGQKDYIYSPSYDFTNVTNGRLKWDYAYTYYQTSYDSLQIMYSIDCGVTWTNLWKKGGVSLATATGISAKFVPTASQWKRDSVSLSALVGKSNVKFAFINITKYGNSLLLDNINIFNAISTCSKPVADFTAAPTTVNVGSTVAFTDLSTNSPTSWAWSFGGGTPATSSAQNPTITFNTIGTYNVTLTASNACGASTAVTKTAYINVVNGSTGTPPIAGFSANKTSVCAGGSVAFVDTSKNTPSSWAWTFTGGSPAASSLQSPTVTYTTPGTYPVKLVVFNAGGKDSVSKAGYITVNANPSASTNTFAVSCFGGSTGSATASGTGGTPGYSYLWSSGDVTSSIINKAAGSYTVTVTDTKSCNATAIANISQPFSALGITMSQTNAYCGQNNGTVTANATGGSGGFSYTWSGSAATTQTISGLAPNTYAVTVTDQKGCTVQGGTSVAVDPNDLTINFNVTDASCGQNNGSAIAIPSGSSIGATYVWSNGQTIASADNLSVGTYQVTVTNASGCSASAAVTIGNSNGPSVSISSFNASCFALNNGSAIASVSSSGNYSIAWSNGQTGGTATNLLAGTYYVTVTESGCQTIDTFTILEPSQITATTSVVNTYQGGNGGYASVTPSGGTQPYSYSWNNGATTSSISGLSVGSYSCTVFDASNCSVVVNADIIPNSVQDIELLSDVSIRPNPATDILQLEFKFSSPVEFSYALTDEIGRAIIDYEKVNAANFSSTIEVSALTAGIYFIQLKTNSGTKTYKFIKQ